MTSSTDSHTDSHAQKTIFVVTNSLESATGGRTRSIINRAALLARQGHSVTVLTFAFFPELSEEIRAIKNRDSLSESIAFKDFFDFLSGEFAQNRNPEAISHLHFSLHQKQPPYDGFVYHEEKKGSISFVNDDTNTILEYRYLDDKNSLIRETWEQKDGTGGIDVRYYRSTDVPFLTQHYKEQDIETKVVWRNHGQPMSFPDLTTLQHYWISLLFNEHPDAYFCLEDRNYDELVINNRFGVSPKSIATIHGCHFLADRSFGIQRRLAVMLSRINSYDAVICLTHQQKQDILDEYGPHDNLYAIRHPTSLSSKRKPHKANNRRSGLVMLSRLSQEKHVGHAIKAMKIVHSENPEIKLTIYGRGGAENKLSKLIEKLHLEDTVVLAGYTSNPQEKLQQAEASLLTSPSEGLSLSVLESLEAGTPCISYDINYGPCEMIIDGENGRLVEPDNIEKLAQVILETFRNRAKLRQMSQFASESIPEDFTDECIANQWENLFDAIDSKRNRSHRNIIPIAPAASLFESQIEYNSKGSLRFTLLCKIGIPAEDASVHGSRCFFLRIPTKPNQRYLSGVCAEGKNAPDNANSLAFTFDLPLDMVKTILETNPDFSLGVYEAGNYAERHFQPSFISAIILKAIPYCNKQTIDCLKQLVRYSHPDLGELRSALPTTDDFALALRKTIETALDAISIHVDSSAISSKSISFEGVLSSKLIPDVNHLDGIIELYRHDDSSVVVAQAPVVIETQEGSDDYHWYSSVSFHNSALIDFTPQMKKQYWKIALKLSYNGQSLVVAKDFKPFATLKAAFITVGSYQGKKVILQK